MNEKKCFKTSIGGQALIEGIVMKGPEKTCLSVRKPDGSIANELSDTPKSSVKKIPIVRGAVAMVENLVFGYKSIMRSAEISELDDEPKGKFDLWLEKKLGENTYGAISIIAGVLGAALSIGLFVVLPTFVTGLIDKLFALGDFKALVEGVLKIVIFIAYLFSVTRIKDIHRVFEYHGAEHKTIACYEAGEELTVENVRKHTRFHPRCGTSFLFIVLIISILLFSFVPWTSTLLRALYKILLLPLVMGLAYEVLKYAGRHDNALSRILSAPGLWVQRLTAFEPDDSQMEVAIAAMKQVIPEKAGEDAV